MNKQPFTPWLRRAGAAIGLLLAAATAHADTTALTDDKSVDNPVGWHTYTNVSAASVGNYLSSNSARLTDIAVYNAATPTFTVTMVKNSGSYAVPGWWWYYNQTAATISTNLANNNARLISIEPYATASGTRFAVVMVSNTGTASRNWHYGIGASSSSISSFLTTQSNAGNPQRLTNLKSYTEGGVKKYVWTSVRNLGSDAKGWEWWLNQSTSGVSSHVNSFGGRITVLERQSDGTYNFVQVKNAGTDNHYWRYHFGLSSLAQANDVANQFGSRVMDVGTYVSGGTRRYDALMIDNANPDTRRIRTAFGNTLVHTNGLPNGQWGAYLKPLGSGATISLNGGRRFEPASAIKAVHNVALMRRVKAGSPALTDAMGYYTYPSDSYYDQGYQMQKGQSPNACPNPADETNTNFHGATVDWDKDNMMSASDNRATRAITLSFATDTSSQTAKGVSGIAALEGIAFNTIGMTDTFIDQPRIGCGYDDNVRNQTTLVDLGRLYEKVENGTLLGTGAFRKEFWQPMNGGAFDPSGDEGLIRQAVQEEGASLGKSSAQINDFIARMEWRFKPGGYGIGCNNAFTPCTNGSISIGTQAGRITLPRKVDGAYTSVAYVFGNYTSDTNTCDPTLASGNSGSCVACPECVKNSVPGSTLSKVRKELFRSAIRENLATF